MRCRPGDLVVVIRCSNAPENVGAIRRVTGPFGDWRGCWPAWLLSAPLPNGDDCACDACLQPIRPRSVDIDLDIASPIDVHVGDAE